MDILRFPWDTVDSNAWLMTDGTDGLLVDAVDNEALYRAVTGLSSLRILLTHAHFDHICGLERIRALRPDSLVFATEQCSLNIGNKYRNMSASANAFMSFYLGKPYGGNIEPMACAPVDIAFDGHMQLRWKGHQVALEAFFGHSNDSMIAVVDGDYMFSGDTILSIPTVTRFPGGSTARFWKEDMPRLEKMQVSTVFPGHGLPGRLEEMIEVNLQSKHRKHGNEPGGRTP